MVSTWEMCLAEIPEEIHLKLKKISKALWLFLDPSCKGNSLARVSWVFQVQIVT